MPRARVRTAPAVKPARRRSERQAKRASCSAFSYQLVPRSSHVSSRQRATPPKASSARRRATSGGRPVCSFFRVSISMGKRSSSSSSRACRERPNRERIAEPISWCHAIGSSSLEGEAEDAVDGARRALPLRDLRPELPASLARQLVVAGTPVVLARAPLRADPPAPEHALQGRVERPLVDVELLARDLPQPVAEPPPVHRLEGQRLE